ncbi:hypothetical protein [Paracoccus sp. (in: a-proteobacteria)]|uniref:hypothetical protein n=1 Tax=Paracoccus sp. TaxID=267 RepID=UPI003A86826A
MKRIAALTAALAASPVTGDADEVLRMQSVWQEGRGEAVHTGLLSLARFDAQGTAMVARGLRLIDVETEVINGSRGFAGLWAAGTGGNLFHVVAGLPALRAKMDEMRAEGMRLVDFEVYREGRGTFYAAVFRNGSGGQRIVRPLTIDKFLESKDMMRSLGLRIVDVEALVLQGQVHFAALYATDAPPAVFTGFRPRPLFTGLRDRMVRDGWELFDVERIGNAQGRDVYFGLWREGPGSSALSRLRSPAEQLFLTARQHEAGKEPVDMELKRLRTDPPPEPASPMPPDPPLLPPNPPHVNVTAGSGTPRLSIRFTGVPDMPLRMEIPESWLPGYLPRQDDTVLVPDGLCGVNIRMADRISWQVGGQVLNDAPFRSGAVTTFGDRLGGIAFSGPIGACAGMDVPWIFHPPFLIGETVLDPPPNLRLVVEGASASLRFRHAGAPVGQVMSATGLFSDETLDRLRSVLDIFDQIAGAQGNLDEYCSTVGTFWAALCLAAPGQSCPLPRPALPDCNAG